MTTLPKHLQDKLDERERQIALEIKQEEERRLKELGKGNRKQRRADKARKRKAPQ